MKNSNSSEHTGAQRHADWTQTTSPNPSGCVIGKTDTCVQFQSQKETSKGNNCCTVPISTASVQNQSVHPRKSRCCFSSRNEADFICPSPVSFFFFPTKHYCYQSLPCFFIFSTITSADRVWKKINQAISQQRAHINS